MPKFGSKSKKKLENVDPRLVKVLEDVIEWGPDFTILCGHRGEEAQNNAVEEGRSKVEWPNSKHNSKPSIAVDIAPYPIDWKDVKRFQILAGLVIATGKKHGLNLRWGGDWDGDWDYKDQSFHDLPHFEIRG